jgi:hypothetical protein
MDALVWWIGFDPPVRTYPIGKVMNALAVLVHVPAWHGAPARVAAPSMSCVRVESLPTAFPFHSSDSCMEIEDTGLVQSTMAVASTGPPRFTARQRGAGSGGG